MCNNTINVSSGWGGDIYLGVWGESLVREVTFCALDVRGNDPENGEAHQRLGASEAQIRGRRT